METSSVTSTSTQSSQTASKTDRISDLNTESFLKLLIAELQNQDPMSPMENTEIMQQVSQIREIQSNQELVDTFQAVRLGQSMSTATSLLGQQIIALSDDSKTVSGKVDRVTVEEGEPKLHVGEYTISLENVSEVSSEAAE